MDRWIRARNSLLERLTSGRFGVSSGCHARSPESPWKTDYVESFNGKLRDECRERNRDQSHNATTASILRTFARAVERRVSSHLPISSNRCVAGLRKRSELKHLSERLGYSY